MDLLTLATSHDERDRGADIAVLPVGSFEQHGAHLPLTTDTLIAGIIAQAVSDAHGLFLLPPVTISCSHEHASFPGTVSISAATLTHIVTDVLASLEAQGIHKLVLISGHGGNYVLSNIAQQVNAAGPRLLIFPSGGDWNTAREAAGLTTTAHADMHGGEGETSILMHYVPSAVRDGWDTADHEADDRPDLLLLGMGAYTKTGIIGRPSLATSAKGAALVAELVRALSPHLDELRSSGR